MRPLPPQELLVVVCQGPLPAPDDYGNDKGNDDTGRIPFRAREHGRNGCQEHRQDRETAERHGTPLTCNERKERPRYETA